MCFTVYIASNKKIPIGDFVPNKTELYFENITKDVEKMLRLKFQNKFIYHVGSDTCCSCGLDFDSDNFIDPEEQTNKNSPRKFLEFINENTIDDDLEYYCCLSGDFRAITKVKSEIDIRNIFLEENYFELKERHYIKFKKQRN